MSFAPCKNCEKRHPLCQNVETCEDYKIYREMIDKKREDKRDYYRKRGYLVDEYKF